MTTITTIKTTTSSSSSFGVAIVEIWINAMKNLVALVWIMLTLIVVALIVALIVGLCLDTFCR